MLLTPEIRAQRETLEQQQQAIRGVIIDGLRRTAATSIVERLVAEIRRIYSNRGVVTEASVMINARIVGYPLAMLLSDDMAVRTAEGILKEALQRIATEVPKEAFAIRIAPNGKDSQLVIVQVSFRPPLR